MGGSERGTDTYGEREAGGTARERERETRVREKGEGGAQEREGEGERASVRESSSSSSRRTSGPTQSLRNVTSFPRSSCRRVPTFASDIEATTSPCRFAEARWDIVKQLMHTVGEAQKGEGHRQ